MKTTDEIRRENAQALQRSCGGQDQFMKITGKSQAQVSKTIGEKVKVHKSIGNEVARYYEECFDKPRGWLDNDHSNDHLLDLLKSLSREELEIVTHALSDDVLKAMILAHYEKSKKQHEPG